MWKQIGKGAPNHYFDCEGYCRRPPLTMLKIMDGRCSGKSNKLDFSRKRLDTLNQFFLEISIAVFRCSLCHCLTVRVSTVRL